MEREEERGGIGKRKRKGTERMEKRGRGEERQVKDEIEEAEKMGNKQKEKDNKSNDVVKGGEGGEEVKEEKEEM